MDLVVLMLVISNISLLILMLLLVKSRPLPDFKFQAIICFLSHSDSQYYTVRQVSRILGQFIHGNMLFWDAVYFVQDTHMWMHPRWLSQARDCLVYVGNAFVDECSQ